MDVVLNAIQVVVSMFLMIGVGVLVSGLGWIDGSGEKLLSRLVIRVALPATIVSNIFGKFTAESLSGIVTPLIIPFVSILGMLALGVAASRLFGVQKGRQGVFSVMFALSNTIFIGLPVCKALFGDEVMPHVLVYYMANTMVFWTAGAYLIRSDNGLISARQKGKPLSVKAVLSALGKLIPLPLLFLAASMLGVLARVTLPDCVMSAASAVGGTVTPLSLIYIGHVLYRMIKEKRFRWQKGYAVLLAARFVLSPLTVIALSRAIDIPTLARNAFLIESAMPVMTQTAIVAAGYGADDEYAAGGAAITTALSLAFIPLYMYVIEAIL